VLFERERRVGSAWRRHYDRLHLHTSRPFSGLPYHPMPRGYPRYPSRAQVVEYLEEYTRRWQIEPILRVEVTEIRRERSEWLVVSTAGAVRARAVVVATGANGEPVMPTWPGLDTFPGPVVHSSSYRNGRPFAGDDVLVVGFGNSGGEIALDLMEHGARAVVAVRSRVNIVPRAVLGVPVLAIAIPLSKLPPRAADVIIWPVLKAYYPSYRRLGLRKARRGPFRQIAESKRIPLLDVGTIRAIRRGRIGVEGAVARVSRGTVTFEGGRTRRFDAIVLATGYRACVPRRVSVPGCEPDVASQGADGLYFCGFNVSPTGMLREIGIEAKKIVSDIVGVRRMDRSA
jgi:indole-3-pyruvate monooxygenase